MRDIKSYLITDPKYYGSDPNTFSKTLNQAYKSHQVNFACFRDKCSKNFEELATIFLNISKQNKIKNIFLNSDINLADKLGFDGVHLTSKQFDEITYAKEKNLKVIISTHSINEAKIAEEKQADFITFSPIFKSPNKQNPQGIEELKHLNNQIKTPIFALGGIISNQEIKQIQTTKSYGFASIRYFISPLFN